MHGAMLIFVRYVLPSIVTFAGLVIMVAGGGDENWLEGGAAIVGAGLSIALLNWLHRVGISGEKARDKEDEEREFYDTHGYWREN